MRNAVLALKINNRGRVQALYLADPIKFLVAHTLLLKHCQGLLLSTKSEITIEHCKVWLQNQKREEKGRIQS